MQTSEETMLSFTVTLFKSPQSTRRWYEVVFDLPRETEKVDETPAFNDVCTTIFDFTGGDLPIILTHKHPWATCVPVNAPSNIEDMKASVLALFSIIRDHEKHNERHHDNDRGESRGEVDNENRCR